MWWLRVAGPLSRCFISVGFLEGPVRAGGGVWGCSEGETAPEAGSPWGSLLSTASREQVSRRAVGASGSTIPRLALGPGGWGGTLPLPCRSPSLQE